MSQNQTQQQKRRHLSPLNHFTYPVVNGRPIDRKARLPLREQTVEPIFCFFTLDGHVEVCSDVCLDLGDELTVFIDNLLFLEFEG